MTNQYLIKKSIVLENVFVFIKQFFFQLAGLGSQIFQKKFYGYINFVMIGIVC